MNRQHLEGPSSIPNLPPPPSPPPAAPSGISTTERMSLRSFLRRMLIPTHQERFQGQDPGGGTTFRPNITRRVSTRFRRSEPTANVPGADSVAQPTSALIDHTNSGAAPRTPDTEARSPSAQDAPTPYDAAHFLQHYARVRELAYPNAPANCFLHNPCYSLTPDLRTRRLARNPKALLQPVLRIDTSLAQSRGFRSNLRVGTRTSEQQIPELCTSEGLWDILDAERHWAGLPPRGVVRGGQRLMKWDPEGPMAGFNACEERPSRPVERGMDERVDMERELERNDVRVKWEDGEPTKCGCGRQRFGCKCRGE